MCMSAPSTPAQLRRSLQTTATRTAIVVAAHRLMLERGYVATSIGSIADEAGVAVQTIYNSVGNKADVLSAVLDLAAAGADAPALCLLYTSDAADDLLCVDLGGRRI